MAKNQVTAAEKAAENQNTPSTPTQEDILKTVSALQEENRHLQAQNQELQGKLSAIPDTNGESKDRIRVLEEQVEILEKEKFQLQERSTLLESALEEEKAKNAQLKADAGIYQLEETYEAEDGETYQFAQNKRKITYRGTTYTVEDAIKNSEVMEGLIELKYTGLVKKGGKNAK